MADFDRESMLEMFSYEMSQLLEQLEQNIIQGESGFSSDAINEIFRIMHTIKGAAAMMMFDSISTSSHSIEDLFFYLRDSNPVGINYSKLTDLVLEGMDFIKLELNKVESGSSPDGDASEVIQKMKEFLSEIKGEGARLTASKPTVAVDKTTTKAVTGSSEAFRYEGKLVFEDGCEMENIRAYTFIHNLEDKVFDVRHTPENIVDEISLEFVVKNGFMFEFSSFIPYEELKEIILQTIYLKEMELREVKGDEKTVQMHSFKAIIKFEEGSEMENVRAFTLTHNLDGKLTIQRHIPEDLLDEASADVIRQNGFIMFLNTQKDYNEVYNLLAETIYLKELTLEELNELITKNDDVVIIPEVVKAEDSGLVVKNETANTVNTQIRKGPTSQHVISVNVSKLDLLLNLMGELVISEAMVSQNPDLEGLELENFHKETRQLRKIINDVQDTVMSMRMVPLQSTFFKMHRIVRDMCKQLNKEVQLEIIGEDTEVDKNIIEHISDPLMHIIRNSIDHGIETPEIRRREGKPDKGTVVLEAKNAGGDVLIIIRDDGAGLNKERILQKAKNNGLLRKADTEYTDKEIHQFIFLPGFSTNESVTTYSGRGVGMDVVSTNLEIVRGSVSVDSIPGKGSVFTLKIPLTLAIIEGMTIKMGNAKYTIPIISIKNSFKPLKDDLFLDPSGNEMIRVRGEVFNVVRLHEFFNSETEITNIEDGIMIMLENGDQTVCLFADDLIGEQQVVVKPMPKYIKKIRGISGCTLLGNGDISLIIDVAGFFDK